MCTHELAWWRYTTHARDARCCLFNNEADMAPVRQRCSWVLLYCKQTDDNSATCNHCKASILFKGGNTNNMIKHLDQRHATTLRECHVFDMLQTAGTANVSSSSSAPSVIAEGKFLQTLSMLVPFVSLCKPAFIIWKNNPLHPFNLECDNDGQNSSESETDSRSGSEAASSRTSAAAVYSVFTEAEKYKMAEVRVHECRWAFTKVVVKSLDPFVTVEAPEFW